MSGTGRKYRDRVAARRKKDEQARRGDKPMMRARSRARRQREAEAIAASGVFLSTHSNTSRQAQKNAAWLAVYQAETGCAKCGEKKPGRLHFHHRDPALKTFTISANLGLPWSALLEEVAKCDVLCANCHADQHCGRFGNLV